MEYLASEHYPCNQREFKIYIYRDNNNDRIQLESYEVVDGVKRREVIDTRYVPMNGSFNLPFGEYPEFSEEMAKCKMATEFFSSLKNMSTSSDAGIPEEGK